MQSLNTRIKRKLRHRAMSPLGDLLEAGLEVSAREHDLLSTAIAMVVAGIAVPAAPAGTRVVSRGKTTDVSIEPARKRYKPAAAGVAAKDAQHRSAFSEFKTPNLSTSSAAGGGGPMLALALPKSAAGKSKGRSDLLLSVRGGMGPSRADPGVAGSVLLKPLISAPGRTTGRRRRFRELVTA